MSLHALIYNKAIDCWHLLSKHVICACYEEEICACLTGIIVNLSNHTNIPYTNTFVECKMCMQVFILFT